MPAASSGQNRQHNCFPPALTAMGTLRIVTCRVGDQLTRPFRDARRFPSPGLFPVHVHVHMYTYAAQVWDLSIVQGPFSVAPCQTLDATTRNFASLSPALWDATSCRKTPRSLSRSESLSLGSQAHAEADAFNCFVLLMSEFRDNFCAQLDHSCVGVKATIASLYDPSLPFPTSAHQAAPWRRAERTPGPYPYTHIKQ